MKWLAAILLALCAGAGAPSFAQSPAAPSPAVDDSEVDPPVIPEDLKVVAEARRLLSSPEVWNRNDDRKCPAGLTRYSLYCALEVSTIDVEGKFAHRGAVMQQARFVVDEITAKRDYQHRLKDYNNDPTTSFADMVHVFDLVEARIRQKLAKQSQPPGPG